MATQTTAAEINRDELLNALRVDNELFIEAVLGEELSLPVPGFHIDTMEGMCNPAVAQFVVAIPRDHAKTTLAKVAAIKHFFFTDFSFVIYLSSTLANSREACESIVSMVQNPNFQQIFGSVKINKARVNEGIYEFIINAVNDNNELYEKKCILRAFSCGRSTRGVNVDNRRPQLAICDDVEDNENIDTEDKARKVRRWFYGPFKKCLDSKKRPDGTRRQKIIQLGNMLQRDSLLYRHIHSSNWYSMMYGALLPDGTPLWPDVWSLDALYDDYMEYKTEGMADIWFAEMMNTPVPVQSGLIQANEIEYEVPPLPEEIEYSFMTLDPAISEREVSDRCALMVHAFDGEKWHLPANDVGLGTDPIALLRDTIIPLAREWKVSVVAIENYAYQQALIPIFTWYCEEYNIEFLNFVGVNGGRQSKTMRIAAWCSWLRNKTYVLPKNDMEITSQLIHYDKLKRENDDDVIDSCAYGPFVINMYIDLIIDSADKLKEYSAETSPPAIDNIVDEATIIANGVDYV